MNTQIFDALGQSIAYDDCKGDFKRARVLAEKWLHQARQAKDTDTLADALICRAIVHLMQGESRPATACLQEAGQLVPNDVNRCLRISSYHLMATYERFNSFPGGNGAGATEISARWQGAHDMREDDARWHNLFKQATDLQIQNEAWLVYAYLCNLKPARFTLESSRYTPSSISPEQMLQTFLQSPLQVQQTAQENGLYSLAAFAFWCCADLCYRAGERDMAQQFVERARLTYKDANDPEGLALCHMTEADWRCAPFSTPAAWNLAVQESSSEGSQLAVSLEADEFVMPSSDAVIKARDSYSQAEQFFQQAGAPRGVAAIHLRYGYLSMLSGDFSASSQWAEGAGARFEDCGDGRGFWLAQAHLIMSRIGAGRLTEVDALAQRVGEWGAQQGSFSYSLGLGLLINRWARHWLIRKGDYERSLAGYRAARSLFEALGATTNVEQNLVDQGGVIQAVGERAIALTLYEQALDLYSKDIHARPRIAENLRQRTVMLASNVFHLYLQQTNADGMEQTAGRLKTLIEHLPGAEPNSADSLKELADQFARILAGGEPETDSELPEEVVSWSLVRLAQTNIEMASVLVPLYRSRQAKDDGDEEGAEKYLAEATAALPAVSSSQRFFLTVSVLVEQHQYDQATEMVRRHIEQGGADAGFTGDLSRVMAEIGGEHGAAEVRLQRQRTHEQAFSMFVRTKAYRDAEKHLEALRQIAGESWWKQDARPWQSLSDCAELYEGLGELERALCYYELAIAELEGRRSQLSRDELKTALAADKGAQYLYFLAACAAIKQGDHRRAFDYAERGKGRGLLDLMAGSAALMQSPKKEDKKLRDWRQINAHLTLQRGLLAQEHALPQPDADRITQYLRQIEKDETQLRTVEAELARSHPSFFQAASVEAQTLSVDQVAAALPGETLLLEYFFLRGEVLGWAIDGEGLVQAVPLSHDVRTLVQEIRAFHRACENQAPGEPWASQLAEKFLNPFAATIRKYPRVMIVPYGAAHILPFHALPFDGQPLIASHTVSYLPSASALQFLGHEKQGWLTDRILAVGNPTGDLPKAATEAAFVASLFNQHALLGEAATEQAVRERISDCPILHFATHGKLSEDAPLASSLSLAKGEELSVYEMMGLHLDADLVVLSACNTGQGETTGGDDVLGLTRGILGAGARAAVVSLWPVDDVSTSLLMGEFYRFVKGGASPAVALQKAQDYLRKLCPDGISSELKKLEERLSESMASEGALAPVAEERGERHGKPHRPSGGKSAAFKDYQHPYYWAPFVLVGG